VVDSFGGGAYNQISMVEAIFFYLFAGLALIAALLVVTSRQPVYSVLALLVAMFCLASLFVLLGAYVVAALQILLYAGAVLVLFLFVIMLLNLDREALARTRSFTLRGAGTFVALVLGMSLVRIVAHARAGRSIPPVPEQTGTVERLAQLLFTKYLLPFELTSFLILAAIIGAITLARTDKSDS